MMLDLMRDKSREFPRSEINENIEFLRIWHCKYKTLASLADFKNLKELVIASFPDRNFGVFHGMKNLQYLKVLHMPNITDLGPLSELENLRVLSLSTSPSWDSARKYTVVDSLEPLSKISKLESLELFGVRPVDKSLQPLETLNILKTARFSGYDQKEMNRFYRVTSVKSESNPLSVFYRK